MPVKRQPKEQPTGLTLTQATEFGRTGLKVFVFLLVVLMGGRFLINGAVAFWKAMNPEPPPPPTMGFGALPPINFTATEAIKPQSYQLEIAKGFPKFPDRARVFMQLKPQLGLLSLDEAQEKMEEYDFSGEPDKLSDSLYRWRKTGEPNAVIEYDIVSNNFYYQTDYLSRPELQTETALPSSFDAVQAAKTFLSTSGLLPADVATNSGETRYLKIVGGTLKEAVSLSDAQVISVELNRVPIDGYRSYTADGTTGVFSALVTAFRQKPTVIKLITSYAPIDYRRSHTYPLRTAQEAWQVFSSGQGHVARSETADTAVIRSVQLGYYESYDQLYLQSVYIFTGDNNFIGMVPALRSIKAAD